MNCTQILSKIDQSLKIIGIEAKFDKSQCNLMKSKKHFVIDTILSELNQEKIYARAIIKFFNRNLVHLLFCEKCGRRKFKYNLEENKLLRRRLPKLYL